MNFDDVDNGETILTSPVFDLSNYSDPVISYERWFVDKYGINGRQTIPCRFGYPTAQKKNWWKT